MTEWSNYRPKKDVAQLKKAGKRDRLSEKNLDLMGIPREFWGLTFGKIKRRKNLETQVAIETAEVYAKQILQMYDEGIGLFLFGSNGVGKTEIAAIIAQEAYRNRLSVRFTTMNQVTPIGVKAGYDEDLQAVYYGDYLNIDFLVIDEVGKEQQGEKAANITVLEEILRHRNFRKLPTILISNLDVDDFRYRYGESIYSLINGRFIPIKIVAEDKRRSLRQKELLNMIRKKLGGAT